MESIPFWAIVTVPAGVFVVRRYVRPLFKVRVNCWFCGANSRVTYVQKNSWNCNTCGQYNGFSEDGDYNKVIQGQHSDVAAGPTKRFAFPSFEAKHIGDREEPDNGLCSSCNFNQELKVHQLRMFTPKNSANEQEELAEFTSLLERTYRLCRNCEAKVRQVLGVQDSWLKPKLLSYKLEASRMSPLASGSFNSAPVLSLPKKLFLTALSVAMFASGLYGEANTLKTFGLEYVDVGTFKMVAPVLALASLTSNPIAVVTNARACFYVLTWLFIIAELFLADEIRSLVFADMSGVVATIPCLLASAFLLLEKPMSKEQKVAEKRKRSAHRRKQIELQEREVEISDDSTSNHTPTPTESHDLYLPDHEVHQSLHDKDQCDISSLQINPDRSDISCCSRPTLPFSIRSYDGLSSSNIDFGDLSRTLEANNSLVRPARFVYADKNRVAQSSWVAGGYWHNKSSPASAPSGRAKGGLFSRSSSQSSGIGSLSSAYALNGKMAGGCGDGYERFSVFSEPPVFANPLNSTMRSRTGGHEDVADNFSTGCPTPEAFADMRPKASSSPKSLAASPTSSTSILDRSISFTVSLYSLLLFMSVAFNVGLSVYVVALYF